MLGGIYDRKQDNGRYLRYDLENLDNILCLSHLQILKLMTSLSKRHGLKSYLDKMGI